MPSPTIPIFSTRPMTVLPDQAADVADLQQKTAQAQVLLQNSMTPQQGQMVGSGPYQIMTRTGLTNGISQLAQALMASKLNTDIAGERRSLSDAYAQQLQQMFGGGSSGAPAMPSPQSQAPQAAVP